MPAYYSKLVFVRSRGDYVDAGEVIAQPRFLISDEHQPVISENLRRPLSLVRAPSELQSAKCAAKTSGMIVAGLDLKEVALGGARTL
jgi:hypothetical protein